MTRLFPSKRAVLESISGYSNIDMRLGYTCRFVPGELRIWTYVHTVLSTSTDGGQNHDCLLLMSDGHTF